MGLARVVLREFPGYPRQLPKLVDWIVRTVFLFLGLDKLEWALPI